MDYFDLISNVGITNILCVECKRPMKTLFHFCGLQYFYEKCVKLQTRTDAKCFYRFRVKTFNGNFYFHRNNVIFSTDDIPKNLNPYLSYINGRFIINQTSDAM